MIERNTEHIKEVMTAREVSEYLKIPLSSLYALTKKGRVCGIKIGKHWRYRGQDILKYWQGDSVTDVIAAIAHRTNPHKDRIFQRINCEIPAGTKILLERKREIELKGKIQNLSEGGLLFLYGDPNPPAAETPWGIEVGDPIKVSFDLGEDVHDDSAFMELQGRIVHKTEGERHALGIKFKSINEDDQRRIHDYVG